MERSLFKSSRQEEFVPRSGRTQSNETVGTSLSIAYKSTGHPVVGVPRLPRKIKVLLGRDVLRHATLNYDGTTGRFVLSFP